MPQNPPKSFIPESFIPSSFVPDVPVTPIKTKEQQPKNWWETLTTTPDFITNAISPNGRIQGGLFDAIGAIPDVARGMWNQPLATMKGFGHGILEGATDLLTPVNAIATATGLGSTSQAVSKLSPMLSNALKAANLGYSGVAVGAGVSHLKDNPAQGIAEIIGGGLGMKGSVPKFGKIAGKSDHVPFADELDPKQGMWQDPNVAPVVPEQAPIIPPVPPTLPPGGPIPLSPVDKLKAALNLAKPLNREQQAIYSAERSQRLAAALDKPFTTQAEAAAARKELAGAHTKVQIEPLKLEQADVDSLVKMISEQPAAIGYNRFTAEAALTKLLTGRVPQKSEIALLGKVFGEDFVPAAAAHMSKSGKAASMLAEGVNLPRALMSSYDMSAPFRQGIGAVHKPEFRTALRGMVDSFRSEELFQGIQSAIEAKPTFKLQQDMNLQLTDVGGLGPREEFFLSNWAEKGIPLGDIGRKIGGETAGKIGDAAQGAYAKTYGRGVHASNRAYVGFLNKLRSDLFDSLIDDAASVGELKKITDANGLTTVDNTVVAKELADFVNNATGRGSLGKLERNVAILNSTLFSPRLIASRVQMLNPRNYIKPSWGGKNTSPMVRKEYLKSALAIAGAGTTVTTLLRLAGATVSGNTTSSDFGKAKLGDTRLDPYGGHQQYIVALNKLATNEQTSSNTNEPYLMGRYGRSVRANTIGTFSEGKLNPILGFAATLMHGSDLAGRKLDLTGANPVDNHIAQLFLPMITGDIVDLYRSDPSLFNYALIPAAMTGMGIQTYQPRNGGNLFNVR